jgi:autotransporter passenger strand-loop-strand repeat protein
LRPTPHTSSCLSVDAVRSGGTLVVLGATAIGDGVVSGGYELVQSGGLATNVDLYGGTLEVASGGLIGGHVTSGQNSGGSTLFLDGSTNFHGLVGDFGTFLPGYGFGGRPDRIDLRDIAFGTTKKSQTTVSFTEAANTLSGTLSVTDGVHTANMVLLGQYTASEFVAASDGHGGTLITFTSASQPGGHHGHGNSIATPVSS